jgi:hypothetical protein
VDAGGKGRAAQAGKGLPQQRDKTAGRGRPRLYDQKPPVPGRQARQQGRLGIREAALPLFMAGDQGLK